MIYEAMDTYHNRTCIRFIRRTTETDYIKIQASNTGCWSSIGRTGGAQIVNLQRVGCLYKVGTPIHEFMHVLGFMHEQNREDRDSYVNIQWTNIRQGMENNFQKGSADTTTSYGIPYDYESVMHYSAGAFSKNNLPTIVAVVSWKLYYFYF